MDTLLKRLADEAALRRSAELYAQGADRRDQDIWQDILSDDCVLKGPGFNKTGIAECLAALDQVGTMFKATFHRVHNQIVTIVGDTASGETYCTADHLIAAGEEDMILVWNIRYQDEWRRQDGGWRFTRRTLIVDWDDFKPRGKMPS